MMEGIIVIDKPKGITSHDVVDRIRRKLHMRCVGHAGTLDPLATGVLVILVGKATKLFQKFVSFDKAYESTLILGITTHTADVQGKVMKSVSYEHITEQKIEKAFQQFRGTILQVPPMVSAVKKQGQRLYQLARRGLEVERQPREVHINTLQLIDFRSPEVHFYVECSKGTYIRQLAEDVGNVLGCGACISKIKRTKVGPFCIEESITLEEVNESHIRHWQG